MKKLILLLLFIPFVSFGQDYGNDSDALKLCTAIQTNNFATDIEAEKALLALRAGHGCPVPLGVLWISPWRVGRLEGTECRTTYRPNR